MQSPAALGINSMERGRSHDLVRWASVRAHSSRAACSMCRSLVPRAQSLHVTVHCFTYSRHLHAVCAVYYHQQHSWESARRPMVLGRAWAESVCARVLAH